MYNKNKCSLLLYGYNKYTISLNPGFKIKKMSDELNLSKALTTLVGEAKEAAFKNYKEIIKLNGSFSIFNGVLMATMLPLIVFV